MCCTKYHETAANGRGARLGLLVAHACGAGGRYPSEQGWLMCACEEGARSPSILQRDLGCAPVAGEAERWWWCPLEQRGSWAWRVPGANQLGGDPGSRGTCFASRGSSANQVDGDPRSRCTCFASRGSSANQVGGDPRSGATCFSSRGSSANQVDGDPRSGATCFAQRRTSGAGSRLAAPTTREDERQRGAEARASACARSVSASRHGRATPERLGQCSAGWVHGSAGLRAARTPDGGPSPPRQPPLP